jgi:hypothetical protein
MIALENGGPPPLAVSSLIPLQLPLAPMRLFAIGEIPLPVTLDMALSIAIRASISHASQQARKAKTPRSCRNEGSSIPGGGTLLKKATGKTNGVSLSDPAFYKSVHESISSHF